MIEFRNVSKTYNNGTEALHDVNLKVNQGEFVFIVGASGAGKSTFLKLVMCEERPNQGKIFINDQEVSAIKKRRIPYVRRKMGIVFQDFRLIDHMTVYENVAFAMRVVGASAAEIRKRVPFILELVGLQGKEKNIPSELSGGERQRVGLARALVNKPDMIVADEPTGNIDPALSYEIVDLLNKINEGGTTILMVTHEHSLVKHFNKRIIRIHSGQIVADTGDQEGSGYQVRDENGQAFYPAEHDVMNDGYDDDSYDQYDRAYLAEAVQEESDYDAYDAELYGEQEEDPGVPYDVQEDAYPEGYDGYDSDEIE